MGRYEVLRHKIAAAKYLPFPLHPLCASRHPVQAQDECRLACAIRDADVALPVTVWTGPRREARRQLDKREWQIEECAGAIRTGQGACRLTSMSECATIKESSAEQLSGRQRVSNLQRVSKFPAVHNLLLQLPATVNC